MACETETKDYMVTVAGEITTQTNEYYERTSRGVVAKIGFDFYVDDSPSVDNKSLSDKNYEASVRINRQNQDIADGAHVGNDDLNAGTNDKGIMLGCASRETEDYETMTHWWTVT